MDYLKLYEDILELLPQGTIQELMEVSYRYLKHPILATDVAYTLLGSYPKEETGDYYWDYLNRYQKYSTEIMVELYQDGIMQSADEHEEPYLVDWGKATRACPKVVGLIRIDGRTEGFVVTMCDDLREKEMLLGAMKIIQQACSILFASRQSKSNVKTMQQKVLAMELLSGKIENRGQLELWYQNTGFRPGEDYMIFAVGTENSVEQTMLSCFCDELQALYPEQLSYIQGEILYVLRYNVGDKEYQEKQRRQMMKKLLEKFRCNCGISHCYRNLLYTADYIRQAEDALQFGKVFFREKRMCFYRDVALPAMIYPRLREMPERNYIHPAVVILQDYDKKHHTEFLKTVKSYVVNLGDSAKMLKELHIHRNSLLYRLAKIEELTGCSLKEFEDFLHLALIFYFWELGEKRRE